MEKTGGGGGDPHHSQPHQHLCTTPDLKCAGHTAHLHLQWSQKWCPHPQILIHFLPPSRAVQMDKEGADNMGNEMVPNHQVLPEQEPAPVTVDSPVPQTEHSTESMHKH